MSRVKEELAPQDYDAGLAYVVRKVSYSDGDREEDIWHIVPRHISAFDLMSGNADADVLADSYDEASAEFVSDAVNSHLAFQRALTSIANSTCCKGCQEAALVAKKALGLRP